MKIGDKIKALRDAKGMQQSELCSILSIEQSTLANYENNRRVPNDEIKIKIATYFKVSVDYLLGHEIIQDEEYYLDPEVSAMADAAHKDPDLKILFSASRKLKKEDLQTVINLVKAMKKDGE